MRSPALHPPERAGPRGETPDLPPHQTPCAEAGHRETDRCRRLEPRHGELRNQARTETELFLKERVVGCAEGFDGEDESQRPEDLGSLGLVEKRCV